MKKTMITLMAILLLAVPFSVFAGDGLWVGPTAMYNTPVTLGYLVENYDEVVFNPENFSYGAEARLDIGIFQASVNAIYSPTTYAEVRMIGPSYIDLGPSLEASANLGIYADLGIVGLGLGAGPRYLVLLDEAVDEFEPFSLGYNVKAEADLILGSTIFSAYFMGYTNDLEAFADEADIENMMGQAGLSVLFQL